MVFPQDSSRRGPRVFPLEDDRDAVDEDVGDALRVAVGFRPRGAVYDPVGVEDDAVGEETFPEDTATVEAEFPGRQGGHLRDGLLEGHDLFLPDVATQHPGEGAVGTGVGFVPAQGSVGGPRPAVGTDDDEGMLDDPLEIVLVQGEVDHPDLILLRHQEVPDEEIRLLSRLLGRLADAFPHEALVFLAQDGGDEDVVPRADLFFLGLDVFPDLALQGGVEKAVQEFRRRPLLDPGRQEGAQNRGGGGVRVTVRQYFHALGLDLRDPGEDPVDFGPVAGIGEFQVGDLETDAGLGGDGDGLLDGLGELVRLVAHVGRVNPSVGRGHAAELDQLVAVGVTTGDVDKARGDAEGAFFHVFPDQVFHRRHLLGCRRAVLEAEDALPHGTVADEGGVVEGYAPVFEMFQELRHGAPGQGDPVLLVAVTPLFLPIAVRDGEEGKAAVSPDLRRDALTDLALPPGVHEELDIGVTVGIDEARGHGHPPGVDDPGRLGGIYVRGEGLDLVVSDGDIEGLPGIAQAVVDRPSFYQYVEIPLHGVPIPPRRG